MSRYEYQIASGSATAHVFDTEAPKPTRRRISGPPALCKRYPQRNNDGIWWVLGTDSPRAVQATLSGGVTRICPDCADALADLTEQEPTR